MCKRHPPSSTAFLTRENGIMMLLADLESQAFDFGGCFYSWQKMFDDLLTLFSIGASCVAPWEQRFDNAAARYRFERLRVSVGDRTNRDILNPGVIEPDFVMTASLRATLGRIFGLWPKLASSQAFLHHSS